MQCQAEGMLREPRRKGKIRYGGKETKKKA